MKNPAVKRGSLFLILEYVFLHAAEGFFDPCERKSQVEADGIRTVELSAVLPEDADFHAGFQKLI